MGPPSNEALTKNHIFLMEMCKRCARCANPAKSAVSPKQNTHFRIVTKHRIYRHFGHVQHGGESGLAQLLRQPGQRMQHMPHIATVRSICFNLQHMLQCGAYVA